MDEIEKKYILDKHNKKIAVQVDIKTFEKIENILEDHGLFKLIQEGNEKEYLGLNDAKEFYKGLDKAN
ncbi:MAG: hypothetical protein A3I68_08865 [Candidatus Melainabacteria bacterium RIFCSPLOWO2_02_FULL_35_15]|nr:MAG: hypothetical protein A3F80_07035 [Candidatus Melainabacteria bacterium RIFCSPLOWO2_12_FULL_35_11]OGI14075.1 MAG: hypothetical protein A3I68_08865 [Candidatus Melainabacteria bacterium RIFCSPLOWO2_02_FULL_35_15]